MTPDDLYEAMKKGASPMAIRAAEAIATSDELFRMLPFVPKYGEGFSYTREVSLGNFNAVAVPLVAPGSRRSLSFRERIRVMVGGEVYVRKMPNDAHQVEVSAGGAISLMGYIRARASRLLGL